MSGCERRCGGRLRQPGDIYCPRCARFERRWAAILVLTVLSLLVMAALAALWGAH